MSSQTEVSLTESTNALSNSMTIERSWESELEDEISGEIVPSNTPNDVTGDVTSDLTSDATGNATGDVTGEVVPSDETHDEMQDTAQSTQSIQPAPVYHEVSDAPDDRYFISNYVATGSKKSNNQSHRKNYRFHHNESQSYRPNYRIFMCKHNTYTNATNDGKSKRYICGKTRFLDNKIDSKGNQMLHPFCAYHCSEGLCVSCRTNYIMTSFDKKYKLYMLDESGQCQQCMNSV